MALVVVSLSWCGFVVAVGGGFVVAVVVVVSLWCRSGFVVISL